MRNTERRVLTYLILELQEAQEALDRIRKMVDAALTPN
jgi:hypothetical protein